MTINGVYVYMLQIRTLFGDLEQLVDILGLDEEKVRVIHTPCGGAFGGKLELTTHAYVAIATYLTGRPAKMVLRRKDSIRSHSKRHPAQMHYKIGVKKCRAHYGTAGGML